jgi:hypothetical protein
LLVLVFLLYILIPLCMLILLFILFFAPAFAGGLAVAFDAQSRIDETLEAQRVCHRVPYFPGLANWIS